MGHSIHLLTAALLTGQVGGNPNCTCQKHSGQRVTAQPIVQTQAETSGWRTTTTESGWRSSSSEGRWIDNRPILSRIRGWFNRNEEPSMQPETIEPGQGTVIIQNAPSGDYYRPLPTVSEPPIGETVGTPRKVTPGVVRPTPVRTPAKVPAAAPQSDLPQITVEPISFRPANAKGLQPAVVQETAPAANNSEAPAKPNTGAISPRFANKVGQPGDYSWITGQLEIRGKSYILHYATPDTVDRFGGSVVLQPQGDMSKLRHGDLVSAHGTIVQNGRSGVYRAQSVDLIER